MTINDRIMRAVLYFSVLLTPAPPLPGLTSGISPADARPLDEFLARFTAPDLFEKNHVVGYYGNPSSKIMGIVGRLPMRELGVELKKMAEEYDALNGERGVIPAIYLVHGTCQPGGEINLIKESVLLEYIRFAARNGFLIYIDHQIGKYPPEKAIRTLLPYLRFANVHLAIDVEWRTDRPMKEIGSIDADELNRLQDIMQRYMKENNIPGTRQLVFHQFNAKMVRNITRVKAGKDPVMLVHTTSGWGSPQAKLSTHDRNSRVTNIPDKGFKLWFYYSSKKGVHFDHPLMSPAQVLKLLPQPGLILYQ